MAGIRAAGASFKLASSTFVMTEVSQWLNEIGGDVSTDEIDATTFSPGATLPLKNTLFGATEYTKNLSGRWVPAAETFFSSIAGLQDVAYEFAPEGTAVGKMREFGSCNVGGWSGPSGDVSGLWTFTLTLKLTTKTVETIVTPPATVAITSSSVANPTVLTTAAHSLAVGSTPVVTISGHTGATPAINGTFPATVLSATTLSIPVNVTVGGTGGTLQN
jgi:hypothetical protein